MKKNKNNDLKHLSFEDYFKRDWREHFQEKETMQSIIDAAGLSDTHDFVQINSRYLIDDNRVAVIALIKRKNTEVLEKLIIDVIAGNSTFEQVYDVVYNTGADCDYRMIICDWNSKNDSPGLSMTDSIMCQLINYFDRHLFLYWICADALRDVDGTMKVIYTVIESVEKSNNFSEIPDRRDLEYCELSLYTWQASGYFSSQDENPLCFKNYYEDENSWAEWTDDSIVTEAYIGQDDYEWLFANRADEVKSDNCSYKYDKDNQVLTITEAVPFQNFRYSLPGAKYDLADDFYQSARIGMWIEDLLGEKEAEEREANPSTGSNNMFSPPMVSDTKKEDDSSKTDPIIYPSVLEFLGPNWREYFLNPDTMKKIIQTVNDQNEFKPYYRKSQRREKSDFKNDKMAYNFVEVDSITHLGTDRERIIATMLDIESGLFEKWSIDISSKAPQLDQMFYALYNVDDGCAKKIILTFKDYKHSNEPDIEVNIENDVSDDILFDITSYADSIYAIRSTITNSDDDESGFQIFFLPGFGSRERGKIPSRAILENSIWNSYYGSFMSSSAIKEKHKSNLITDIGAPYSKTPFFAWPEWTDKGLFMRLYTDRDCPETNWLIKFKKDELARRYKGCEMQVDIKPSSHYSILIPLHQAPVADFVESQTLAKFNYALEIREQQSALIKHVEEIFQDFVPESK
jgi:hypothetical protein